MMVKRPWYYDRPILELQAWVVFVGHYAVQVLKLFRKFPVLPYISILKVLVQYSLASMNNPTNRIHKLLNNTYLRGGT